MSPDKTNLDEVINYIIKNKNQKIFLRGLVIYKPTLVKKSIC